MVVNGLMSIAYNILFIAPHLYQRLVIIVKEIFCLHELLNFLAVMSNFILVRGSSPKLSICLFNYHYLTGLMGRAYEPSTLGYLSWFTQVLFLSSCCRILFKHLLVLLSPRMPYFMIIIIFAPIISLDFMPISQIAV